MQFRFWGFLACLIHFITFFRHVFIKPFRDVHEASCTAAFRTGSVVKAQFAIIASTSSRAWLRLDSSLPGPFSTVLTILLSNPDSPTTSSGASSDMDTRGERSIGLLSIDASNSHFADSFLRLGAFLGLELIGAVFVGAACGIRLVFLWARLRFAGARHIC